MFAPMDYDWAYTTTRRLNINMQYFKQNNVFHSHNFVLGLLQLNDARTE